MISIQAITFDLDDTLWAIEPVIVEAEKSIYDWLSVNCPRVTEQYTLQDMRQIRAEVARRHPEYAHDLGALRKLAFEQVFFDTGYAPEWVERAYEEFMRKRNQVDLYPDALPALKKLSSTYPIASLTNGNADLTSIGIVHHFTATVAAQDHGVAKPHADIFLAACRSLGREPHQVVHIGDDPEHDVLGAANAGLRTIWLNRNRRTWDHPVKADLEVENLLEVVEALNI